MKLRPNSTSAHSCVRCNAALDLAVGQVRATCAPCAASLSAMHAALEYAMFRRTYYWCSTEGTSFEWLINNGYSKEIQSPKLVRPPMVQVTLDDVLKTPWSKLGKLLESSG